MKVVFQDPTFSLQLLRAISETYNKGADIGECLSTAYRIKEGDFESWYIEWLKTAKRFHKYADECLASGHDISAMKHGMWTVGVETPFELITKSKDYTIKDIAQNIKCPTLVLDAENDDSFPGQPKKVFEDLSCPKRYILFTTDEGAEEHCQCGAAALSNQRIFDWLDETLK
jgi:hypothetical protein